MGDVHIMANVSHTKISIACKMASIHVGAGGVLEKCQLQVLEFVQWLENIT